MLIVRPAGPNDYKALMELAVLSGAGFTSLPEDEPTLRERLDVSQKSFRGDLAPLECWYTLMLEDTDTGSIDGVAGVKAAVGLKRPFFSFRSMALAQYSKELDMRFDHTALVLVNECSGWTEVGSLFLKAQRRTGGAGRLLAQSRYLMIATEPERFNDMVLAELRGYILPDGTCPFWDHVSSKFFRMPFSEADRLSGSTDGQFILDLAPRHAIYTEIMPDDAREAIGRCHPDGEAARALLEREGFRANGLVDIFDAGPTMVCGRDDIRTIRDSVKRRVRIVSDVEAQPMLIANTFISDFRAARTEVSLDNHCAYISRETADALKLREDDLVRVKA